MSEVVEVANPIDRAIIEAIEDAEKQMLPRKAIIRAVKDRLNKNEQVIAKRIEKISKEPTKYLLRSSRGIYKVNPDIEFIPIGEKLPAKDLKTKPIEVSPKAREEHTKELKKVIENWVENFPKTPYVEDSRSFFEAVVKCENYPLFKDLSNHLPKSRFNICHKWAELKNGVEDEDKKKEELLKLIEKKISAIFRGLKLKFVRHYNNLSDYECSLPFLIYNTLINYEIGTNEVERRFRAVSNEEEDKKFIHELSQCHASFFMTVDRFSEMIIFEKGNSAIWGETEEIFKKIPAIERWECVRVPKEDIAILQKGKDQAISIITESTPEIERSIESIIATIDQLEKNREYLVNDLRGSLFYKVFLGDCKYLGAE